MKLPEVRVAPVGKYALGSIQQPNYGARGRAIGGVVDAGANAVKLAAQLAEEDRQRKIDSELSAATGAAAQELAELRSILEDTKTIPSEEIPEGLEYNDTITVTDDRGEEKEVSRPFVYTHEIANEWWERQSNEIIGKHAATISSKAAQGKFSAEMTTRYGVPGTLAINKSNTIKARIYNQAVAQRAIEDVLASGGPTLQREQQAREILARQVLLGADPMWAEQQHATIGPEVDRIDAQNALRSATTADAVDQVEEDIWTGGSRMSPSTRAALSVAAEKRRRTFKAEDAARQLENGEDLKAAFIHPDRSITRQQVADSLSADDITGTDAMILFNALNAGGGAAKASNQFTLSAWRGEIIKLPWTGNQSTVTGKAAFMKLSIQMAVMGLNPNGTPTGFPPSISGTDAATLIKDIDAKVKTSLESIGYQDAWAMAKTHTGVTTDILGQIYGNQSQREAAILFKQALDNYMNQYGIDAKPVDFFNANKEAFAPEKFTQGVDQKFHDSWPQTRQFMELDTGGNVVSFNSASQDIFVAWLRNNADKFTPEERENIAAQFLAYYRGQGIAPDGGELMLEADNPLYNQFGQ